MKTFTGSCHCGAVRSEITSDFPELTTCDCSICRRKNALMVKVHESQFKLLSGGDLLNMYQFHTFTAKHYFCSVCGIYTHHKRRSNPNELGVNVACLVGMSPFDFREVKVHDGERHPADNAEHKTYAAGVLRFEPASRLSIS